MKIKVTLQNNDWFLLSDITDFGQAVKFMDHLKPEEYFYADDFDNDHFKIRRKYVKMLALVRDDYSPAEGWPDDEADVPPIFDLDKCLRLNKYMLDHVDDEVEQAGPEEHNLDVNDRK